ncbi:MAG: SpoIIE family protein phosphatase [Bacteroidales bacterium]|nr:MAG: SpoIIE family protein phosphatase [Bacteroidales bacterium]
MAEKESKTRLQVSKFKLNSLLAITQAINENLSVEELLKRYEKILREDLNIGTILIYKFGIEWECILTSGCSRQISEKIDVEQDLLHYDEITFVPADGIQKLKAFDIIIPVHNNNAPLAFVLIGDIEEEGEGVSPTIKHLTFIQTLSNIILVAIENIRLFKESLRQEAIKKELELASRMQNMLIPDNHTLPRNERVYVTGFYHPHYDVGGDYYDCLPLNQNDLGFCIADVSGKGISAALLMSNFQANLRALFTSEIPLKTLVERLNERVISSAAGEKFITLFIAKYNCNSKILEYINAAHNPPVIYETGSKKIHLLNTSCVGIGMIDHIPVINEGSFSINERSKIICYTDGLSELPDENGNEIGTDTIAKYLANQEGIEQNINQLIRKQNIMAGNDRLFDDVSIIGVEFF